MRKATAQYNLKLAAPMLAKEWNWSKNNNLSPDTITPGSQQIVWWKCKKGHEWTASVINRKKGNGCPFCSGRYATEANNLAKLYPRLAKEWHTTKNINLSPRDVTPRSDKKVWWICSNGHVWQSAIKNRSRGSGCPVCTNRTAHADNCLAHINPTLATQWHPTKNEKLTASDVTPKSGKKVWWRCGNGHEWEATVASRSGGNNCPYCSNQLVSPNKSLQAINPVLAKQWHPNKNGDLTPTDFAPKSGKKVWWACANGHEWPATISSRTAGSNCPYCANRLVTLGNSLFTINPSLSLEWHPTRNGTLTPKDVLPKSSKKVWWVCQKGHEWQSSIAKRSLGRGCHYCANRAVNIENCLATINPSLAKEWHPTKNAPLTPADVTPNSGKRVWWVCPKGHEWATSIDKRNMGGGCPKCHPHSSYIELKIFSELKHLFHDALLQSKVGGAECDIYIPSLKAAIEVDGTYWHKNRHSQDIRKNNILQDHGVTLFRIREPGLSKISTHDVLIEKSQEDIEVITNLLRIILKTLPITDSALRKVTSYIKESQIQNDKEFHTLYALLQTALPGKSLAEVHPKLAKEWHPSKNGDLSPNLFTPGSGRKVWWMCQKGHEWQASILSRSQGNGCPYCSNRFVNSENCLSNINPNLAKQWHPTKNSPLTPKDVTRRSGKAIWWICDSGHIWKARVAERSGGSVCPFCSNKAVTPERSLSALNPTLAKEWHPSRNAELFPKDVTPNSSKRAWWLCAKGHSWQSRISHRNKGSSCPECYREHRKRNAPNKTKSN